MSGENSKLVPKKFNEFTKVTDPTGCTFAGYNGTEDIQIDFSNMTPLFGVTNEEGGSETLAGSQDLVSKKTSRSETFNISQYNAKYDYADSTAARNAVPASLRGLGQQITYQLADGNFSVDQFLGKSISGWNESSNWIILGNKNYIYPILLFDHTELFSIDINEKTNLRLYDPMLFFRGNIETRNIETQQLLIELRANTTDIYWTETKLNAALDTANNRINLLANKEGICYNISTKKVYLSYDIPKSNKDIMLIELRDNKMGYGFNSRSTEVTGIYQDLALKKQNTDLTERVIQNPSDIAVTWENGKYYNRFGIAVSSSDNKRIFTPVELPENYSNNWYITSHGVIDTPDLKIATLVYLNKQQEVIDVLITNTPLFNYKIVPPVGTKYIAGTDFQLKISSTNNILKPFRLVQASEFSLSKILVDITSGFSNIYNSRNINIPVSDRITGKAFNASAKTIVNHANYFIQVIPVLGAGSVNIPVFNSSTNLGFAFVGLDMSVKTAKTYAVGEIPNGARVTFSPPVDSAYLIYSYFMDGIADSLNAPRFDFIKLNPSAFRGKS